MKLLDLAGKTYGILKVLSRMPNDKWGNSLWKAICICGTKVVRHSIVIREGKGCGCRHGKITHGFCKGGTETVGYGLWKHAKRRAIEKHLHFYLQPEDIKVPVRCPVFGFKLQVNKVHAGNNSPTLDRKEASKGYTKKNIWVISHKANRIKGGASLKELKSLVKALQAYR